VFLYRRRVPRLSERFKHLEVTCPTHSPPSRPHRNAHHNYSRTQLIEETKKRGTLLVLIARCGQLSRHQSPMTCHGRPWIAGRKTIYHRRAGVGIVRPISQRRVEPSKHRSTSATFEQNDQGCGYGHEYLKLIMLDFWGGPDTTT